MGNPAALTFAELAARAVTMLPAVAIGGAALREQTVQALRRIEVDTHLYLPDMFTLTFDDPKHDVLTTTGLKLGAKVEVKGGIATSGGEPTQSLLIGEVTAIEGSYAASGHTTVVRGYTADHRLQRARRTRSFLNTTDSDAAKQIAGDCGLTVGDVADTKLKHPHLGQRNVTDWTFLTERAREIGYEVGVRDDRFFFRRAGSGSSGPPVEVELKVQLQHLSPRISAGNLTAEAEVRSWDPVKAKVIAARRPAAATAVSVGVGTPGGALSSFGAAVPAPAPAGAQDCGPPPSAEAHVLNGHGLTVANGNSDAVDVAAEALAERATSGFAEARGELLGDARVIAGAKLKVSGVPAPFAGTWTVTSARHVFDRRGGGYRTQVEMSGRAERSMFALTGGGGGGADPHVGVPGVVCGLVTDVADPLHLGRVKVALPWLAPDYETDWAPVSQLGASSASGALFLPSPNDQVLLAFEHGDMRRPYVLGSLVNERTGAGGRLAPGGGNPGKSAVKAGWPASVIRRGLVTPSGSHLVFHDDVPPSGGKPTAAQVVLGTEGDKIAVTLDQVAGTLAIKCEPAGPPGKVSITCGGDVEITAGSSGSLSVDGGAQLTLKGKAVKIEGESLQLDGKTVAVKGNPIRLN